MPAGQNLPQQAQMTSQALDEFRRALEATTRAMTGGGRGRGAGGAPGSKVGLGTGGAVIGGAPSIIGGGSGAISAARAGIKGGLLGGLALSAPAIGYAARTGDLSAAASLGARSFSDALGSLPFVGEVLGFSQQKQALNRAEQRANEVLDGFARFNLPLAESSLQETTDLFVDQEARIEQQRQRVRAASGTAENLAKTAPKGTVAEGLAVVLLTDIRDILAELRQFLAKFG